LQAFNEVNIIKVNIIKDILALSAAEVEKAAYIYRKVMGRRLIHRRSISGIMASAVYAACMEVGSTYTLRFIQLNRK
jgi:transcription initiation factor TFIIB